MGQTLSTPITEKHSDEGSNDLYMFGLSCMQGWRVTMEDSHSAVLNLNEGSTAAFFAVFDGHGGQAAAKYSGRNLAEKIIKEPHYISGDYSQAIKKGFLGLDYDLKTDPEFLEDASGCTAVCTLITHDKRIFCGNAGDSRAVLSVKGVVKELSFDHKPQNTDEYARIYKAGGFVEYGRVNGNLALSRAFGDFEFKQNMTLPPEEQAVTANPDVTEHQLTEEDEFIVIACDGIWDCMTSQDVVSFVRIHIAQGDSLRDICEKMMDHCLAPSSSNGLGCDNMTVLIVGLLNGKTPAKWTESISAGVAESQEVDSKASPGSDASTVELESSTATTEGASLPDNSISAPENFSDDLGIPTSSVEPTTQEEKDPS